MHTVTFFNAANNCQTVKVNRTTVIFSAEFTKQLASMRSKKMLTDADMPTIGKFTIVALGNDQFSMSYVKNGMMVRAAILTIKGNKIVPAIGK